MANKVAEVSSSVGRLPQRCMLKACQVRSPVARVSRAASAICADLGQITGAAAGAGWGVEFVAAGAEAAAVVMPSGGGAAFMRSASSVCRFKIVKRL